jgi:glycosyltransferase involved in cell wall biosynthesis
MFCYIGNIIPHKLSSDFLAKICETDLVVDCYGSDFTRDNAHGRVFDRAVENGNIVHHGLIPQDKIAEVMNEYKYFVLPHDGYEPFNWVLKQCAFCGTIPLVVNDRNTHLYNGKWLDWAAGLYMGCQYTDDFISNLEELVRDRPDHREMSDFISTAAKIQFPYQEFKEEFQSKARELLNG